MYKVHRRISHAQLHHSVMTTKHSAPGPYGTTHLGVGLSLMGLLHPGGLQGLVGRGYMCVCLQVCEYNTYIYIYICICIYMYKRGREICSLQDIGRKFPTLLSLLGLRCWPWAQCLHKLDNRRQTASLTSIFMKINFAQRLLSAVFLWRSQVAFYLYVCIYVSNNNVHIYICIIYIYILIYIYIFLYSHTLQPHSYYIFLFTFTPWGIVTRVA